MSKILHLPSAERKQLDGLLRRVSKSEKTRVNDLLRGRHLNDGRVSQHARRSGHRRRAMLCPHAPSPKQREFLALACREAFYGGAAGGGKSEALLMAALEYVHVPGYAALILRKDTQRLRLAGGLIPRSQAWLAESRAIWNEAKLQWRFPTSGAPATVSFGYLQTASDKFRYGSSEYQYIAFDELTEFSEEDYVFLFSRLRSAKGIDVPLRMRAASNPGGPGHAWVKARFIPDESERRSGTCNHADDQATENSTTVTWKDGRAFVPARITDNPGLDAEQYRRSLAHLPSVLRQRLERGDWSVHEAGLIQQSWLRYYTRHDRMLDLLDAKGRMLARIDERNCRRFVTIDPAGTSADRAKERRGRAASWTVVQIWDQPQARELSSMLILRHVARRRVGFDGLCQLLKSVHRQWLPRRMFIENEKLGQAAVDVLGRELPLRTIATGGRDKVTRAAPLVAKLERGEIFLPRYDNAWRTELEAEWLSWTGMDDETTDQIDAAAYAVVVAKQHTRLSNVRIGPLVVGTAAAQVQRTGSS